MHFTNTTGERAIRMGEVTIVLAGNAADMIGQTAASNADKGEEGGGREVPSIFKNQSLSLIPPLGDD